MAETQGSPLDRVRDELELQAWLARAELRQPSSGEGGGTVRDEVSTLASLRDELRLQIALGRLEFRDEFEQIEHTWRQVKQVAESKAQGAVEALHDLLRQIRDGYHRLRSKAA